MVLLLPPYFLNFPQVLFNYVLNTARPNLPVGFDPSKWWVLDMAVQYAGEGAMKKLGKRIGLIEFEVSSECRGSDSPCRPPKRIPRPRSLHPRAKRTYDILVTKVSGCPPARTVALGLPGVAGWRLLAA